MKYESKNIKTLEGLAHIKKNPTMYIGSIDSEGLHHLLKEIVSNSIDEFINGSGNQINIVINEDNSIIVEDFGRGIPLGKHSTGCSTLQAVYGIVNTSGKFDKDGNEGYNTSAGINGLGSKAVNALSDYLTASTIRDGVKQTVYFENGIFIKEEKEKTSRGNGVIVSFKPSSSVFETVEYNYDKIANLLKEMAFLCAGLTINLEDKRNNKKEKFYYQNGLEDYLKELNEGKQTITKIASFDLSENETSLNFALQYNSTYTENIKVFTNMVPNIEGGTHLTGFRSGLTRVVNIYARENKLLKDKDDNLTGDELKEGLCLILNLKILHPLFQGQHKNKLTNSEARTIVERLVVKALKEWLDNNPNEAKAIVNKGLLAKKAKESAKRARENIRKKTTSVLSSPVMDKLADCSSKNVEEREIYLVEGK
ncbi:MAG: hypothetical protein HUJ68_04960 [Clostridia bacterium]|nr:hypothetical protein [Clostridia bacterium]